MNRPIVIIFHKDCSDGFGAAWAAWKKFGKRAEYIGVAHNHALPAGLKNKIIYMLDFTYDEVTTRALIATNQQVTSLDHHITRETATKLTQDYRYALDHSGAVLAWTYFHPDKPIPRILQHIEDMDLWKFKLPDTRAVATLLNLQDFDFKFWDRLIRNFENSRLRKQYLEKGKLILAYEERMIQNIVAVNSVEVDFAGHRALAVNCPKFASEIGHALTKKLPPIGIVWKQESNHIKVSLRSDGTVDVAKIAESFGGGGHKASSGFTFPLAEPLPWKIINR